MNWKDNYREHKDETGLSWDDYHDRYFVHTDELADLESTVSELSEHVAAVTAEYKEMRHELNEVLTLLESEEFDP